MGVHDLNFDLHICDARGFQKPGVVHEWGQAAVRTGNGVCALEDLLAHHRTSRLRCRCFHPGMRRLVSRHGVLPAGMARIAARHPRLLGCLSQQGVSHGIEGATVALDAGRCVELEPPAYLSLSCAGAAADRTGQSPVRPRANGARSRCQCVRLGCHHHRPVPELVRLGTVSFDQGRHQAAHAAGSAWGHSSVHSHQRWQASRRERARHPACRCGRLLRDGSWIRRLCSPVCHASGWRILRHPSQSGHGRSARLLRSPRPQHRQGFTTIRRLRRAAQTPGPPDGGAGRRGMRRRQD